MSKPARIRRPVNLTLSVEARAALETLAAGPPRQDMSRVVERLLLREIERVSLMSHRVQNLEVFGAK